MLTGRGLTWDPLLPSPPTPSAPGFRRATEANADRVGQSLPSMYSGGPERGVLPSPPTSNFPTPGKPASPHSPRAHDRARRSFCQQHLLRTEADREQSWTSWGPRSREGKRLLAYPANIHPTSASRGTPCSVLRSRRSRCRGQKRHRHPDQRPAGMARSTRGPKRADSGRKAAAGAGREGRRRSVRRGHRSPR